MDNDINGWKCDRCNSQKTSRRIYQDKTKEVTYMYKINLGPTGIYMDILKDRCITRWIMNFWYNKAKDIKLVYNGSYHSCQQMARVGTIPVDLMISSLHDIQC